MASSAEDLRGSRVLVGISCLDPDGDVLAMIQTYGILTDLHDDVIVLTRNDGSTFGLPPDPTLLEAAGPGVYTLRGTGESIEDTDYLVRLTITINDATTIPEIEAHGFRP